MSDKEQVKEEINNLTKKIDQYNKEYYIDNKPTISDAEYDQLFHRLKTLEDNNPEFVKDNSPTQKVGFKVQEKFNKYQHKKPMLSLANGFSDDDINDFISKIQRFLNIDYFPEIFCEPKIDGVSFSLTYENGKLISAATRGDGYIGEDITENIKTIKNLPDNIDDAPEILEIRGEIYIEKQDFEILNQQQKVSNNQLFANPRNCAAGSLRQLDSNVTAARPLKYFVYALGFCSDNDFVNTQQELLEKLENRGFNINPLSKLIENLNGILSYHKNIGALREKINYEIDGIVYKVNDYQLQERLGFIARSPRFAIAHKFPAIIGKTKLNNIVVQVGRTGTLTPVAELEPINIGGVNISRATLHNFEEIKRLDIRINDTVLLYRAGDVIPKITDIDKTQRPSNSCLYELPKYCPSCDSELEFNSDDIIIRCNNGLNCLQQLNESIKHFVSKNAMNIDGMGRKQVEFLLEKNIIKNPVDIFKLAEYDSNSITKLANMPGWGAKSVSNLFENIEKSKNIELAKFIYALGIRHIGESNAKILAREFKNADNFFNSMIKLANEDQEIFSLLDNLDGIGDKILVDMQSFFKCEQSITTIKNLIGILNIQDYEIKEENNLLSEYNIVFTGSLKSLSRNEAKAQAEKLGAKIGSSITNATNLVVAGEKAGSKLDKAKKLGIKIISEEEWSNIVTENN